MKINVYCRGIVIICLFFLELEIWLGIFFFYFLSLICYWFLYLVCYILFEIKYVIGMLNFIGVLSGVK